MTALDVFTYEGTRVRVVVVDGDPWFVLGDLTRVLGLTQFRTDRLDGDVIRNHPIADSTGRSQMTNIVSEAGMYEVVIRSDKPEAVAFRRWITHEVVPSIRRTGSYAVPETREQLLARAVIEANTAISEAHQQIEALTPRAEAWDEFADAGTDYAVADAAALLNRAGIQTGRDRLFAKLAEIRWIYRGEKRRWRPYASAVDAGYLTERAQPPHRDADGVLVPSPPQVRITARGVERLRVRLGVLALTH
ncbi:phage antirepressor KilAC domain-containing protein [Microbacterium esteraromaticum]|uniref:phage antirepressor KilAC domain-containing protein n=1 Tax=Microbacterium esteraromaticum TaxID=57043 RepID=UPI002368A7E9|nr:phage antirepressor KilAC domain-containing protein [Microbacterium esteraromaticum]WDH80167.1 phage antirepressor KilAC domain-containing protein [Microbacterium esteraromaticum]